MRTTLDIEGDVLFAAKDLARREKKTAGQVISELARKGLTGAAALTAGEPKAVCGFRPLPKEGRIVSNQLINKLREDGEY
ncbi:MAG: antitoxin [Betaproteobacteria bacterium]|nr:antitoxin [Betaproteobacteria bacterium]